MVNIVAEYHYICDDCGELYRILKEFDPMTVSPKFKIDFHPEQYKCPACHATDMCPNCLPKRGCCKTCFSLLPIDKQQSILAAKQSKRRELVEKAILDSLDFPEGFLKVRTAYLQANPPKEDIPEGARKCPNCGRFIYSAESTKCIHCGTPIS